MKPEEEEKIRDRMEMLMKSLKKVDVANKDNQYKILVISAALRELQWVLDL